MSPHVTQDSANQLLSRDQRPGQAQGKGNHCKMWRKLRHMELLE